MWCYAVRRSLCSIALSNPLYEVELNNVQHQLSPKYITKKESLSVIQGKHDNNGTLINRIRQKNSLECEFDELSENNLYDQILKTTICYLMRVKGVKEKRNNK